MPSSTARTCQLRAWLIAFEIYGTRSLERFLNYLMGSFWKTHRVCFSRWTALNQVACSGGDDHCGDPEGIFDDFDFCFDDASDGMVQHFVGMEQFAWFVGAGACESAACSRAASICLWAAAAHAFTPVFTPAFTHSHMHSHLYAHLHSHLHSHVH